MNLAVERPASGHMELDFAYVDQLGQLLPELTGGYAGAVPPGTGLGVHGVPGKLDGRGLGMVRRIAFFGILRECKAKAGQHPPSIRTSSATFWGEHKNSHRDTRGDNCPRIAFYSRACTG
jgi:hypothetical protein